MLAMYFFIELLGLLLAHERVEVFTDAGEVDEPAAMNIPFVAEKHGFHFPLRHQVVEGPTLDAEKAFHIPPPSELRHHTIEIAWRSGCHRHFVINHAATIDATLLPGHQSQVRE